MSALSLGCAAASSSAVLAAAHAVALASFASTAVLCSTSSSPRGSQPSVSTEPSASFPSPPSLAVRCSPPAPHRHHTVYVQADDETAGAPGRPSSCARWTAYAQTTVSLQCSATSGSAMTPLPSHWYSPFTTMIKPGGGAAGGGGAGEGAVSGGGDGRGDSAGSGGGAMEGSNFDLGATAGSSPRWR